MEESIKNVKRLDYIDVAKGIGIILVVGAHLIGEGGMSFATSGVVREIVYQFHMPLFFIISGFTIALSLNKNVENRYSRLIKRALMLLVGYSFWSLIFIYLSKYRLGTIDYHEELICMLTLQGRAPIWFLAALSIAELGYLFCRKITETITKNKKYWHSIFAFTVMVVTLLITNILVKFDLSECSLWLKYFNVTITRFFPSVAFVAVGVELYTVLSEYKNEKVLIAVGACLLALTCILTAIFHNGVNMHTAALGRPVLFYINAIVGSCGLIVFSMGLCGFARFRIIQALGKSSKGIMIFHYPPYFMTFHYSQVLCGLAGINQPIISFMFCLAISLASTYALTLILKKYNLFV